MAPTKYNLAVYERNEKKNDIRLILLERALRDEPTPLTYKQLCGLMKSPPPGPAPQNSNELRGLLDAIDREEAELGHGMLTSFVFSEDERTGQPFLPGKGFYSLAKKLGYQFQPSEAGKLQFALEQMRLVSAEQALLRGTSQ